MLLISVSYKNQSISWKNPCNLLWNFLLQDYMETLNESGMLMIPYRRGWVVRIATSPPDISHSIPPADSVALLFPHMFLCKVVEILYGERLAKGSLHQLSCGEAVT